MKQAKQEEVSTKPGGSAKKRFPFPLMSKGERKRKINPNDRGREREREIPMTRGVMI